MVARAGTGAQWAECLPTMQELLGSIPALLKLGWWLTPATAARGRWRDVQGQPCLNSKFKDRLGYIVACLKRGWWWLANIQSRLKDVAFLLTEIIT